MKEPRKWSRKHEQCIVCNGTHHIHTGGELCKLCWTRKWYKDNGDYIRAKRYQWYLDQGGPLYAKLRRENKHFSGLRQTVLKRDGYRCQTCSSPYQLVVHHKDGNGRGSENPNNIITNLITLCKKCHMDEHRRQLQSGRGFIHGAKWSPKYGLEACRKCKRSDLIHNAGGLCVNCYSNKRYKANGEKSRTYNREQTRRYRLRKRLQQL